MKAEISTKKQFIINTAADLFKEKGYSASSMRDLAARVGIEPSSIYSHIRSKEELLSEICMSCAIRFTEGIDNISNSDNSSEIKIRELIDLHLHVAYDHPASITVFNDEWKFLPEKVLGDFLLARKKYEKKFKQILMEGKYNGKFEFDNVDIVFNIIIKTLSWSYHAVNKHNKTELKTAVSAFILKALNK